ncbi:uncharacterized membrane protein (UPF0182 family) [Arcanobacterium wilhelmae]|uniref:UPF0182 protein J2S49_000545 n=1 Tax=Arcanobacterium wilhelmae TaxID=1803177 RepID=A0ABT9N9T0_9ACTO|nr:UPF0182 family protein [Arcanobacterium wilhelmae]MDP9800469.1 uncharacterized membrane protein (UPF0182 family) [Arcanobacterium wilhelmae]WFN89888.1 UPF0182 family protein [Arcanobacterium wilhelmae]
MSASVSNAQGKAKGISTFVVTLGILGALVVALTIFANFWTEMAWFSQIEAVRVFWTQYGAAIGFGVLGVLVVAVVAGVNARVALGKGATKGDVVAQLEHSPVDALRKRWWLTYLVGPAVLGLVFGASMGRNWQSFLLWFNATKFGKVDPEYGLDVGFYVFTLPVLKIGLSFFFLLLLISFVVAAAMYWMGGHVQVAENSFKVTRRAQIHVAVVAALGALGLAANYWLSRYELLLGNHDRFSGASYTDINASVPGLTILSIVVALIALAFVWAAVRGLWRPAVVGVATAIVVSLVVSWIYPALVQSFRVTPNAAELESEYIQRNINATRDAYGIADIETQSYDAVTKAEPGQLREDSRTAAQIRLLDPNIVEPSFNQLQQNRQYYTFLEPLTVGRYNVGDEKRDTVIGVRELNLNGLDQERRSWVNDHTVYTHGYGVAAAFGNTVSSQGDPKFWESGIPSRGELGEYEPRIYFGKNSPDYSIVGAPKGATPWELDYPDDKEPNGQKNNTYTGDGGPAIGDAFSRLMFAIKFASTDIFFSERVTDESQILFDRDPAKRVSKVAPYLTLDSKAVPAVVDMDGDPKTPKRVVWIIDAYTTSNNYPYSARQSLEAATNDARSRGQLIGAATEEVNYIRNSVKAVVDAFDGSVSLYQWDEKDPVINAWKGIFPGQLKPLSQMSGDLMSHVRYPEDLFKVQRELLARYHVTDAKSFYSGGDFWKVPKEPTARDQETAQAQPPYYMSLQMPGQKAPEFSLTSSFIPGGTTQRNIMNGFFAASGDAGNEAGKKADSYGKLRLLDLPRGLTIPGPGQAENTMVTNPRVSQDINLLDQRGTKVQMGNLLSLPVGGGMLYVQPVYVQASSGTQYPTLQYVLTLFGDTVGFAPTLDESLNQVFGGNSGVKAGDAAIAGQKEAPLANGGANAAGGEKPADQAKPAPSASPAPSESASATPSAPAAPAAGSPAERLNTALTQAKKAITDSEAARKAGDWTAYGKAQEELTKAVEEAAKAQSELGK